jgi:two-component system CheB/CheR fusion protein
MPKKTSGGKRPVRPAKAEQRPLKNTSSALAPRPAGPPTQPNSDVFPIVGLGASAGGLEAISTLLRQIPDDTGMGFVVVQHLDPKHESLLVELLSKSTGMPIELVREGVKVQPDRVYVIPPNHDMVIREGALRLLTRSAVRGLHMPIDHFFRSLAAERKGRAIGVILSGTNSDGALGVEAIKGEGGITFAQDDKTAKYDGMPRAAIATGYVDFVLPPEDIARELAHISQHPYIRRPDEPSDAETGAQSPDGKSNPLTRIFALLRTATSVDFSLYKHTTIRRRIGRRMALHKVETLDSYLKLLEQNPAEVEALYREILIKVTGFFRDPEMFQTLKSRVLPEIVSRLSPESPIRIWVPGCATGEEAYSLAILLLEYLGERNLNSPVQIFATDVSEDAIEKARSGIYLENISLDVTPERLRRFFIKLDGNYQVSKTLRDVCIFARQNIAKDPPFSKLDLISCRNVLIYLEPVLQKRIIPMFHYALKNHGFLLLGSSETTGTFHDLFEMVNRRHRIYVKRQIVNHHRFEFEPGAFAPGRHDMAGRPAKPGEETTAADLQKEADRIVLSQFGPPGVIINDEFEVVQFRGRTSPFLEPAPGKASLNLLKMVREGLLLEIRHAVQEAKRTGEMVRRKNIPTKQNGFHEIDFEVIPLHSIHQGRHYLIVFRESPPVSGPPGQKDKKGSEGSDRKINQLKQELVATRQYLQSIIEEQEATNEELQSANEEILSSNEELQSINEELETAKEELQSTNEELTTVNEELQNRNSELSQINDDLNNLLSSVNMAIVMLDHDLRIRRFTPMAGRILNLIATDIGRPITDLRPAIQAPDLGNLIHDVLDTVSVKEREVTDTEGRWYSLSIRPYRTSDNRIAGVVLILINIDIIKRGEGANQAYQELLQAAVEAAAGPMAVLDRDFRIQFASRDFHQLFGTTPLTLQGRLIEQGISDGSKIRELAEAVARGERDITGVSISIDGGDGAKELVATVRQVLPPSGKECLVIGLKQVN